MFKIAWADGGEKRSKSKSAFQDLLHGNKRSEIEYSGREERLGLGEGLKPGREGIQGESQIFMEESGEITQQAFDWIISLFFKMPFQIQESECLMEADRKSTDLKYLAESDRTQSESRLLRMDHPSLAKRALFRNSICLKPKPPKQMGLQIFFQPIRDKQCFFSWG